MSLRFLLEGKRKSVTKVVELWLDISDMFTELEDELLEIAKDDVRANKAIEHLRKNELKELHLEIRKLFGG